MIKPSHPLRRPRPMLYMHLGITLSMLAILLFTGGTETYHRLFFGGAFILISLLASLILYLMARRAYAADRNWPVKHGRLNLVWSSLGPASIMGWMLSGLGLNSSWGESIIALPLACMSTLGFCLFTVGLPHRIGDDRRCAKCDYPTPRGKLATQTVCSECGAALGMPGAVAFGRRQANPNLIITGTILILCAVGVRFWTGPISASLTPRVLAALPNSMLINEALHARFGDTSAWTELVTRKLTPLEADRIIASIPSTHGLEPVVIKWIEDTSWDATLGTHAFRIHVVRAATRAHAFQLRELATTLCAMPDAVDADVRDGWFESMFSVEAFRTGDAKVGHPLSIVLKQISNTNLPATGHITMFAVASARFGDELQTFPAPCLTNTQRLNQIAPHFTIAQFNPATAGPTELTVTLWLAYLPTPPYAEWDRKHACPDSLGYPPLTLDPDGAPIRPKHAQWFKKQVLVKTIEVAP